MDIQKLQSLPEDGVYFYDNKLLFLSYIHKLKDVFKLENQVVNCLVISLVTNGQVNLVTEDEEYHIKRGDFFACKPYYIIKKSMSSLDFEALTICLSTDYCIELANMAHLTWTFRNMVQQREIIHLDEEQISQFASFFDFIRLKIQSPETSNKSKCIDHLLLSLIYQVYDTRVPQKIEMQNYSPQENLMQRFARMLKDSNPLNDSADTAEGNTCKGYLSVIEYAEKLCVTPKYFSTTCKRFTGMTAGQIIDKEIMATAKILLHDNTKSIKQIAEMLGFANQSHFGTYFNRKTGMSPLQFRNSM